MPNWVSNSVRVTGNRDDLQRFMEQAGQPTTQFGYAFLEERESHLSFWNFVRPDDSILDEYWGSERQDLSLEERLQYKTNHWYDWNIRNWGCKWDASDVYFEDWDGELAYDFETPWGFPYEAIEAMVKQYPTLTFSVRFLEEQGWGGEALGTNGEFGYTKEWDIPSTHEERVEYIGYCYCEEMRDDEQEWMYEDCPKRKELADVK
jgi:hypothetical protein